MKTMIWLAAPVLLAASLPSAAQVYRCTDPDTGVPAFTDVPCDENAEIYEIAQRLSVIARADNLDAVVEQNQAFLEQRSEQLEQARRQRAEAAQRRSEPSLAPEIVRTVPVYPVRDRDRFGRERPNRPRPDPRPDNDSESRRQPVSALSGRQLGSRRDEDG